MGTAEVTILKVIGDSSISLLQDLLEFSDKRVIVEDNSFSADDWNSTDKETIDSLITTVVDKWLELPVVHAAKFLDPDSEAIVKLFKISNTSSSFSKLIATDNYSVWFTDQSHYKTLKNSVSELACSDALDSRDVDWFYSNLINSFDSYNHILAPSIVLCVIRLFAPTRYQEEIEECLSVDFIK